MGEAEIIPIEGRDRRAVKPQAEARALPRCRAVTKEGKPCKKDAVSADGYCSVHAKTHGNERSQHPSARASNRGLTRNDEQPESLGIEEFLRRRISGDYPVDDFGYDEQLSREVLLPLIKPIYENYFRVRTLGIDRIPDTGSALLICNHSGTIPLDAVMMQYAVATEHAQRRLVRNVGADLVWKMPLIGPLARKSGNVVACDEDAYELIRRGELIGVFPEGYKGVGKGWSERYKLQRFGRGGYIELALRTKTPIIPVAIVGAEEAFPMIFNAKLLAKVLGFPYFPITPTFPALGPLGLLPLRSRWVIEFGEPIPMDDHPEDAADDPMYVFDQSDHVRDTIQQMLYANLNKRGGAFF
jgi:1-acyl-sn-glycerol-3-phosphate acyltransferase